MKLSPYMYHLNTFHFHRNESSIECAGGGHIQKSIKKCQEIHKISTLTSNKISLQNAIKAGTFIL